MRLQWLKVREALQQTVTRSYLALQGCSQEQGCIHFWGKGKGVFTLTSWSVTWQFSRIPQKHHALVGTKACQRTTELELSVFLGTICLILLNWFCALSPGFFNPHLVSRLGKKKINMYIHVHISELFVCSFSFILKALWNFFCFLYLLSEEFLF